MFWSSEGSNYLCMYSLILCLQVHSHSHVVAVGMRNSIVNTYLIDEMEEQKVVNFRSFMRDKWDLWMGKCTAYHAVELVKLTTSSR